MGPTKHSNGDPRLTLTYLTSRSNLLPNAFKWEISRKLIFFLNYGNLSHFSPLISRYKTLTIYKVISLSLSLMLIYMYGVILEGITPSLIST